MIIFVGRNGLAQVRCLAGVCDPIEIIEVLRERGLWGGGADPWDIDAHAIGPRVDPASVDPHRMHKLAMRIWEQPVGPIGTPAKDYLRGRGLVLPASMRAFGRALSSAMSEERRLCACVGGVDARRGDV